MYCETWGKKEEREREIRIYLHQRRLCKPGKRPRRQKGRKDCAGNNVQNEKETVWTLFGSTSIHGRNMTLKPWVIIHSVLYYVDQVDFD